MSGEHRSRRNIPRVDYTEPGDDPVESASESSSASSLDSLDHDTTVVASESFGEPLSGSSPKFSIVEREAREMATSRANQLTAEVEVVFFQLGEIKEDVNDGLNTMSMADLNSCASELKDLRITLVKAHQELNLVSNERSYDDRVREELAESKLVLNNVKGRLSALDSTKVKAEESRQQHAATVERMMNDAKVNAFRRSYREIESMFVVEHYVHCAMCPADT